MGKTSKPLKILIHPSLKWEELQKLQDQNHDVQFLEVDADLILGPNCWKMNQMLRQYLPLAIKAAREQRYGKGKKSEETD